MARRFVFILAATAIVAIAFALNAGVARAAAAPRASAPACLDCHGPFDKLTEKTATWKAPTGEKTSPHRYVPHDSKKAEDIPDCKGCHAAHPLDPPPASGSIKRDTLTVEWCYTTCHHEKTFEPCKKCHKTDGK
jgi:hypothetical protein